MTRKIILFLVAKIVLGNKMFGKGDGFPDRAETPKRGDFYAMMYYDWLNRSLSSNTSRVCQTALETILHHDLQFTSGTRNFSLAERRLKTVAVVASMRPLLPNKTWPR